MSLDRGLPAKGLSSLFYTYRNTINIYTEDEDKDKKFYTLLFRRLLEGTGVVVNDIHPLGNCEQVIQHCKNDSDTTMPKIYIIDGDIYLMTKPRESVKHLYILDTYCMENKVIDENAYYKVFGMLDPFHEVDEIKEKADYNTMMTEAEAPFMKLQCHFAVCREALDVYRLKSAQDVMSKGSISNTKVNNLCTCIKDDITKYSGKTIAEVEESVINKMISYPANRENLMRYVSGKDYLLVYIDAYTKKRLNAMSGQKKEFWKYQFMKYCDLQPLDGLRKAILNEVREFNESRKADKHNPEARM